MHIVNTVGLRTGSCTYLVKLQRKQDTSLIISRASDQLDLHAVLMFARRGSSRIMRKQSYQLVALLHNQQEATNLTTDMQSASITAQQ